MRGIGLIPLVVACALAGTVWPQELKLKSGVSVVVAPVSVTNQQGKLVDGLSASDFEVLADGKPVKAELDEMTAPFSLVLIVEATPGAAAALAKVRKMGSMLEPLLSGAGGDVSVQSFAEDVRVAKAFGDGSVSDSQALQSLKARGSGGAVAYDAVMAAARDLSHQPKARRRVILLIGEAKDRGSVVRLPELMQVLDREDVVVYTLTYSAYLTPFTAKPEDAPVEATNSIDFIKVFGELGRLGKKETMDELARGTGGASLKFVRQDGLEKALVQVGEDLHRRYTLTFKTPPGAAGFHTIEVRVRGMENARVRARLGYWTGARD